MEKRRRMLRKKGDFDEFFFSAMELRWIFLSAANACTSCRYQTHHVERKTSLANIGFDTAENGPLAVWGLPSATNISLQIRPYRRLGVHVKPSTEHRSSLYLLDVLI